MMVLASILELWNNAWPAGLILLGLAVVFALVLLIASKKWKVEVDPKVEQVQAALPSIDCGACGYAGCGSYAKAVVENPELIGKCAPGGGKATEKIGGILNLQISESGAPKRPIIHCRAHKEDKTYLAICGGIGTCISANAMPSAMACTFGCIGYGDCVSACKFNALHIIDGLATVDYEKCTGCGACSKACPRNLIEMAPFTNENMMVVACSSIEAGKDVRKMCQVGCIACGICVKQSEVFSINDNLARVDYEKYQPDEKTEAAYNKCPTCVIVYCGKNAPAPRFKEKKKTAASKA